MKHHYRCDKCDGSRYRILNKKLKEICCYDCGFKSLMIIESSKHKLKELDNTGLFHCVLCNKAERELEEPCIPKNILGEENK